MPAPSTFLISPILSRTAAAITFALASGGSLADAASDARLALERGDHAQALRIIKDELKADPGSAQFRLLHALTLDAAGRSREAITRLESLINEFPAAPAPYNNLARIHARRGDLDKARTTLERAISANPQFATLYGNLNALFEAQARAEYAKALDVKRKTDRPTLSPILAMGPDQRRGAPRTGAQPSPRPVPAIQDETGKVATIEVAPIVVAMEQTAPTPRSRAAAVQAQEPTPEPPVSGSRDAAGEADRPARTRPPFPDSVDSSDMRVSKLRLPPEHDTRPEASVHDPILSNKISIARVQPELSAPIDPVPDTRPEPRVPAPVATAAEPVMSVPSNEFAANSGSDPTLTSLPPVSTPEPVAPDASTEGENRAGAATETGAPVTAVSDQAESASVLSDSLPLARLDVPASPSKATPEPETKPAPKVNRDSEAIGTLEAWAAAWSTQDVDSYLSFYGTDFKAPKGNRAAWAELRRKRLSKPKSIRVELDRFRVQRLGNDRLRVRVEQDYRSDRFHSTVTKVFELGLENSEWRIVSERVER
ncbi:MAG: L,D-transpeptidase Cds6 family protein [Gammaproteobacteria bacterium]